VSDVLATKQLFPADDEAHDPGGRVDRNVDGMMSKVADFFDAEIEATVAALTSLMEPILICFLGVVVGGIVMAMFLRFSSWRTWSAMDSELHPGLIPAPV